MLVIRPASRVSRDERGSALVVTLIIMLVLTIAGLALATIVTATTTSLVGSRNTAQSRAAADAGIAAGVSEARRTGDFCSLALTATTAPKYTLTSACASGQVTFTSVGTGAGGGQTTSKAVYNYSEAPNMVGAAELVFFSAAPQSVYFTSNVMPVAATPTTVLMPGGGLFECKTTIPGSVRTKGSIQGQSGCTINGDVAVGGDNPVGNGNNANALYLNNADQVLGSAQVNGNVLLGNSPAKIGGTLTLPTSKKVVAQWGTSITSPTSSNSAIKNGQAGGIVWASTVAAPTFDPWFEYPATAATLSANWPGYTIVTLTDGSSPISCTNWKGSSTTFWTSYVSGLTTNTVIDARACKGGMDTALGANSTATLGVNLTIIANAFTLGNLNVSPKAGTTPQMWLVVPDTTNDGKPTCPASNNSNQWDYKIENDGAMNVTVKSMMYTPCLIRIGAGGKWTGSMYSGHLQDGGGITIYTSSMALPGQWGTGPGGSGSSSGGAKTLGTLVSQRDVP